MCPKEALSTRKREEERKLSGLMVRTFWPGNLTISSNKHRCHLCPALPFAGKIMVINITELLM